MRVLARKIVERRKEEHRALAIAIAEQVWSSF
jgi:hypothetical protein